MDIMDSLKQFTKAAKEKASKMKERASNFKDRISGKELPPRDGAGKLNHALKDLANKNRPMREKEKEEADYLWDRYREQEYVNTGTEVEGGEWVNMDKETDMKEEQYGE